jgi:hypothetical protein
VVALDPQQRSVGVGDRDDQPVGAGPRDEQVTDQRQDGGEWMGRPRGP